MGAAPLASDAAAVRVVAWLRVGVAIAIAATGSFLPDVSGDETALFLVLGLLWVPWSCVVLFAADRPGSRLALLGGPAGDMVALFAFQVFVPGTTATVLLGYLVVIAYSAYTAGRDVAALLAAAALALTVVAETGTDPADRLSPWALAPFSAAVVALVFLLDRTMSLERKATLRSEQLEGKAAAVLDRVADAVVVTDVDGRVVQCNPAARRVVADNDATMVGQHCAAVLALHAGERALDCTSGCQLLALEETADTTLGHEVWRLDRTGRRQPFLANAAPVMGRDGRMVEVVHSLRDVTRLKEAEEAKTLFLATASHELKTPLTVIMGFAEMLLHLPDSDVISREAALAAIERRAKELNKIVDRLLLSSRVEAGRVDITLAEVRLGPIVSERATTMAAATGRIVRCEIDAELPPARGDEHALVTVIDHLLENAIKYSPEGEPVTVAAGADGRHVHLRVRDAGIGMDAEQIAHCFDKFWQAESTDTRRFNGTGIGLYIVRSLVEAMGGRVGVESAAGHGTTFTVWLTEAGGPQEHAGEATSIREFMRQLGVPQRAGS